MNDEVSLYFSDKIEFKSGKVAGFIYYDKDSRLNKPIQQLYLYVRNGGGGQCRLNMKNVREHEFKLRKFFACRFSMDEMIFFGCWLVARLDEGNVPSEFGHKINFVVESMKHYYDEYGRMME